MRNLIIFAFLALVGMSIRAATLGPQFSYQGLLEQAGAPVNGNFDLQFEPFDQLENGTSLAPSVVIQDVPAVAGVFNTTVDFGPDFFVGDRVFLAIGVRPGSDTGPFTVLTPRQEVTPTPHAHTALSLVGGAPIPTGVVMAFDGAILPDATWIWSDGQTIGNAVSGATNRASQDTRSLFVLLWNAFDNIALPIQTNTGSPTSRGLSALEDFDAGKRLPVPDRRGRVNAGLDQMGGTPANRLTAAASGVDGSRMGASGGTQTETLTVAQIPSHFHSGITLPASHDDNPDPPLNVTVIGNNFPGSMETYNTATTGAAGGGQPHRNVQPTIVTSFIIKL